MEPNGEQRPGGRLSTLARSLDPWGFPIIYLGWAFVFWAPVVGSDASVWSFPNVVLFVLGGSSPLVAGVLFSWLTTGRDGVRDLGRRLIERWRIDPRWWLVIVLFWPVFTLLAAAAALALGITSTPLELVSTSRLFDPVAVGSILFFGFVAALPEEVGLRGYWLDRLQERWSALVAGLINGSTWAVWHAPFLLLPGYYAHTTF